MLDLTASDMTSFDHVGASHDLPGLFVGVSMPGTCPGTMAFSFMFPVRDLQDDGEKKSFGVIASLEPGAIPLATIQPRHLTGQRGFCQDYITDA